MLKGLFFIWSLTFSIQALAVTCGCDNADLRTRFSIDTLDYLGILFNAPAEPRCITATTDKEAAANCAKPYGLLVNPTNPQYSTAEMDQSMIDTYQSCNKNVVASIDKNPVGIYFCLPYHEQDTKAFLCQGIRDRNPAVLSRVSMEPWKSGIDKMEFRWVPKNARSNDGDCQCRVKNAGGGWSVCTSDSIPPDSCRENGYVADSQTPPPAGSVSMCKCLGYEVTHRSFPLPVGNRASVEAAAHEVCDAPSAADATSGDLNKAQTQALAAAAPTAPSTELKQCVDRWVQSANSCKTTADNAKRSCDTSGGGQGGSLSNQLGNAMPALGKAVTRANAGTGAQETCFEAGLAASSAQQLLTGQQTDCSSDFSSCSNLCGSSKIQDFGSECFPLVGNTNPYNQSYYSDHKTEIESAYNEGTSTCTADATKNKSDLDKMLSGVGESLHSSLNCVCQLSATVSGDCSAIVPPTATCATNPSLPACNVYSGISVCTVGGENYDAQLCACQTNPRAAGCATGSTSGTLSGFASGLSKSVANVPNPSAPLLGGASGAALTGSAVDLSGLNSPGNDVAPGAVASASNAGGSLPGTRGGGSGGAPSPGNVAGADTDASTATGKGFLSDLFGQAKTVASKLGIGKASNNGDEKGKAKSAAFDPTKYKPRGVANSNGVGSKNMDIWKMMNNCVQGETCRSNINNYIESP